MSILMSLSEFQFLTKDNYSNWKSFIQKFLCGCGHQLWDVVTGSYTRADAQDKQKFDVIDRVALDTIRRAIDKEVHPWVSEKFTSSKELWDYIELKFQRQEQKKMKKRAKQKQRKLKQRELVDFLILPVPEIQDLDSASNCLEDFLAELPCMDNPEQHMDILEQSNDGLPIQMFLDDVHHIAGFNDTSHLGTNMAELLDFPSLLSENIQQLEVPILDDFLDFADLSSMAQTVISDYVDKDLVLESIPESSFGSQSMLLHLDLQHEVIESNYFLHNDELADLFSGEDQKVGNTQVFMAEEEEMVSELPWLEIDSKTCDFQSVLSQVSDHELPLYVNLHIPFRCPHNGNVEHHSSLNDSLGFLVYADVEGVIKKLQVSYSCLHLRNQVFMIVDLAEDQNLVASHGKSATCSQMIAAQCVEEFHEAYYGSKSMVHSHSLSQQFVMTLPGQYVEEVYNAYYGSPTLEQFGKAVTLR